MNVVGEPLFPQTSFSEEQITTLNLIHSEAECLV